MNILEVSTPIKIKQIKQINNLSLKCKFDKGIHNLVDRFLLAIENNTIYGFLGYNIFKNEIIIEYFCVDINII